MHKREKEELVHAIHEISSGYPSGLGRLFDLAGTGLADNRLWMRDFLCLLQDAGKMTSKERSEFMKLWEKRQRKG